MSSIIATIIIYLTIFSSLNVWVEPSWITNPGTSGSKYASYRAQIFACKGEEESFQLHIISDKDLENLSLVPFNQPSEIPLPQIYIVKPIIGIPLSQGGIDKSIIIPDILYPSNTTKLLRNEKAIFWVTYKIPIKIEAKSYSTELALMAGNEKLRRIEVDITIFDFEISPNSLPAITFLDPIKIANIAKIKNDEGEFYRKLFGLIHDKRLIPSFNAYFPDINATTYQPPNQKMWSIYLESYIPQKIIDVTPLLLPVGPLETIKTPTPEEEPIWKLIQDKANNLSLISVFAVPENKDSFKTLKRFLGSIAEQVPTVQRTLCGIPLSFFNTQIDIYAIPFYYYSFNLIERLKNGYPLSDESRLSVKSATSSSCGPMPATYPSIMSSADNIIDGNIHTGWFSLPVKDESKEEWIEIQLKEPLIGERVLVIWGKFQTPRSVNITISKDTLHYFPSSVNWKHFSGGPYEYPTSIATFKYFPEFLGLKIQFSKLKKNEILNIQEIVINPPENDDMSMPKTIPSIQPWLLTPPNDYPSLRYYAHPIEPRIIPWICWNLGLSGVVLTPLISWGNTLTKPKNAEDFNFTPQDILQSTTLLYPSEEYGFLPSVRLERLRDGLEDYEYLKLLTNKASSTKLDNQELYKIIYTSPENFLPWNATKEDFIENLIKIRVLIGAELSNTKIKITEKDSQPLKSRAKPTTEIIQKPVKKNFTGKRKDSR